MLHQDFTQPPSPPPFFDAHSHEKHFATAFAFALANSPAKAWPVRLLSHERPIIRFDACSCVGRLPSAWASGDRPSMAAWHCRRQANAVRKNEEKVGTFFVSSQAIPWRLVVKVDLLHRFPVSLFEITVEGDVLVHGERLPPGMVGDKLKLCIGETGMPGAALVLEAVRRGVHARLLCVLLDDLLNAAG